MNRNPFEQMKALRKRRARDRAEQERPGTYDVGDTQPITRYPGAGPAVSESRQEPPARRRRPLVVGLAAGAVAGAVLAFGIPAIASGLGGSPSADVSSPSTGQVRSGGGGSASATPSTGAPSAAPDTSAGAGAKNGPVAGNGVCPRPHPDGPGHADRAPGKGHRPPAPPAAGKGHRPPAPPAPGSAGAPQPPAKAGKATPRPIAPPTASSGSSNSAS